MRMIEENSEMFPFGKPKHDKKEKEDHEILP